VPDWTYHPLRPVASTLLGEHRTRRVAMRTLATVIRYAGGRHWIPRVFDHPEVPPDWVGRFGATVSPAAARDAITVLPVQGAGVIEVGPVGADDIDTLRAATAGRTCPVVVVADTAETARAAAPYADRVRVGADPDVIRLHTPSIDVAVEALAHDSSTVLATTAVLTAAGPSWFHRVIEAATPTAAPQGLDDVGADPRRWPGWLWGVLLGIGMIVAGFGAAAIALGPVLLWYDRDYLGLSIADLHAINHHLVGFLQHDRITMAGNMIGIGVLYAGLAWGGIRRGHRWARNALLLSGLVTFGTYLYFLGTGFLEPLHTAVVLVLFPIFVFAIWRTPAMPRWGAPVEGPEAERRRALWGQLLMTGVGGGLFVAGAVISAVGLTSVFVPTDLSFLGVHSHELGAADPQLPGFIAHDRAGFGGALMGAGLAVLTLSMWGWRRGEVWVWWVLLVGCAFGTVPVLIVHFTIGYTSVEHLLPVYVLILATGTALALARPFLAATTPAGTPAEWKP
jgi:hypothetical protein